MPVISNYCCPVKDLGINTESQKAIEAASSFLVFSGVDSKQDRKIVSVGFYGAFEAFASTFCLFERF